MEPAGLIFICFCEVLGLRGMEKVVSKRDDFKVDALFYFESVQRFEYRVICSVLRVLVTTRAREFCSNWRRNICFSSKFRYGELQ